MRQKVQEKHEVIRLRKQGLSYREILQKIPVAKSSISSWLSNIDWTENELKFIEQKMKERSDGARLRAAMTNRTRRIERDKKVFEIAKKEFKTFINDSFFVLGVALYWAEGAKKSNNFQFVNSDPEVIKIMIKWIEKYMGFSRKDVKVRLYIHYPYADENCEEFWSGVTKIPVEKFHRTIYKPTLHKVKKNPKYKGCFRIGVGRVADLRKVFAWQKLLIEYYEGILK